MASGEMEAEFKFFLYAQERSGGVYLVQLVIDKLCEPRVCSLVVKSREAGGGKAGEGGRLIGAALGNVGV